MADLSIKILIDGVNSASAAIKSAVGDLGELEKRAGPLNTALSDVAATMAQVGIAATAMGASIGLALGSAVKSAAEFQNGLNQLRGVVSADVNGDINALNTTMGKLSETALQFGSTSVFSAGQATAAMTDLKKAGYSAAETTEAFAVALKLAAASGTGVSQTAETLVQILTPFGLKAKDAANAANILTVASNETTASLGGIAEAMKYAAAPASSLGISLNETAGAIATLAEAGIQGSMAGTAVRGMLTDLVAPTKKAQEAMANLNVQIVKNEDGSVNLIQTFKNLRDANMTLADAAAIFGVQQASAALSLAKLADKFDEVTKKTYDNKTAMDDYYKITSSGLVPALQTLWNALNALNIALGSPFLDALTAVVNKVADGVRWLTDFAKAHQTLATVVGVAVAAIGVALTVFGLLAIAIAACMKAGQLFLQVLQQSTAIYNSGLIPSIRAAITATLEEAAAHKANAAALQAEASAAKTSAAAKGASTATSGTLSTIGGKLGGGATGALAFGAISSSIASATEATNKWGDALTTVGGIISFIPTPLSKIVGVIAMILGGAINLVSAMGLFKSSTDAAAQSVNQTGASVSQLDAATKSMVKSAHDAGQSWGEFRESYISTFKEEPPDEVRVEFFKLRGEVEAATKATADALKNIGGAADLIGAKTGDASKTAKQLKEESERMATDLTWAFQQLHRVSAEVFDGLTKTIDTATQEWQAALKLGAGVDSDSVVKAFDKLNAAVSSSLGKLVEESSGRLAQLQDRLQQAMDSKASQKEIEALQKGIEQFGNEAIKTFEKIAKDSATAIKELETKYSEVLKNINKLSDDMAKQEISDQDKIAKARTAAAESGMNDAEKYSSRVTAIKNRQKEIEDLIAAGGEDNLKRARQLAEENLSAQASLTEVKMKYIDLYPEEGRRIASEIQALEQISGKTQEQKDQLTALKNLYNDKVVLIDKAGAAEDRNTIINQAQNNLAQIRQKYEEEKGAELEDQRKTLEDQIARMKEQNVAAEDMLSKFRQAIGITLDTSGAKLQMEELFQNRVIKATIDISGAAGQGMATGGLVRRVLRAAVGTFVPGGYGGGDIVPALLEPGEFVFRKEVVKNIGVDWFKRINSMAGNVSQMAQGGIVQRFAEGGTVQLFSLDHILDPVAASIDSLAAQIASISLGGASGNDETMDQLQQTIAALEQANRSTEAKLDQMVQTLNTASTAFAAPIKINVEVKDGKGTASVETW